MSFSFQAYLYQIPFNKTLACGPLGMEDGAIADWQITASSYINNYEPWRARLRNTRSWAAKTQILFSPWIQVEFNKTIVITGIQTQSGRYWVDSGYWHSWVKTLQVQYWSKYGVWIYIADGSKIMVGVLLSR